MTTRATLADRQYVSQFASPTFGLRIVKGGEDADADGNVSASLIREDDETSIASLQADHISTGHYEVSLTSAHTQDPGLYTLRWTYAVEGETEVFEGYIEVGPTSPVYDALDDEMKGLVEVVWSKFADLYDSVVGGPHLQVYAQTQFSRGRLAQLLRSAIGRLNTVAQPKMAYTVSKEEGRRFPLNQWGGLLEQALLVEVIKHLRRSYVEDPAVAGGAVTRMDRRDYLGRWGEILRDEQQTLDDAMEVFKIRHMGLGRPRVLVSGGMYGNYSPTRSAPSAAARPRYWARWY